MIRLATLALAFFPLAASAADKVVPSFRVMSYNLRYADDEQPNAWSKRRPLMKMLLTASAPDLLGTQEGLWFQLEELNADLPGFARVGRGNDDGETGGEHTAIFYRTSRFKLLKSGQVWLSDTPDKPGSRSWGNTVVRTATWARFRDLATGVTVVLWNTHFDHESEPARRRSARLLKRLLAARSGAAGLIVTGDFNALAGTGPVYETMTKRANLKDAWVDAAERVNEEANSFTGFGPLVLKSERIDWILYDGRFTIDRAELVTYRQDGQWPSDHLPMVAVFRSR